MEELFRGIVQLEKDGEWLLPRRFTQKQLQSYTRHASYEIRSQAPAGVRLAFRSAAKTFSLTYEIRGKGRPWAAFDLWENGMMTDSCSVTEDRGRIQFSLSGDKTVKTEIFLPHLVQLAIRDIQADAPLLPCEKKKRLWLCIGDSVTQGMDAVHPSLTYPPLAAKMLDMDVINMGVGGATFHADDIEYIGEEPDMITVSFGTNDWGWVKSEAELRGNISAYLEKLIKVYACRNIFGILPIWRNDAEKLPKNGIPFERMREIIRKEYEKYPFIRVLDGMEMLPAMELYYGDAGELKAHPNELGFTFYAMHLAQTLQKHLETCG